MRFKRLSMAVFTLAALTSLSATAREEIPAETREIPYSAQLSACNSPAILSEIQSRFARTEREYWHSNAEITGFERIRQAAFRPHGLDLIPRRYCQATARMSNSRPLKVRYAIIEDGGTFGYGEGVQFCLDGYDRNLTAMPGCYRLDR